MQRRSFECDSSDEEGTHRKSNDSNRESVSAFYKSLYGLYISENEQKKIREESSAVGGVISSVRKVEATNAVLEAIGQKDSAEPPKIAKEWRSAMLDQAVYPDEFMKRLRIAKQSYSEVSAFASERKTKQDIIGHLLVWKRNRELLTKLVNQMNKNPEQVREEVEKALPELKKKAQRTLDRLEQIPDWQEKVAQLEEHTREKLRLSRGFIQNDTEEIRVGDSSGDGSTEGPRFYAELAYRTRTVSKIIDRIIEPSELRWQGSPEGALKGLVKEAAGLLSRTEFSNNQKNELEDYIYERLCKKKDGQQDFSTQTSDEEYKRSIASITAPPNKQQVESEGYAFFMDYKEYEKRGRFTVNMLPDAMIDGTTKKMMEEINRLDCVYCAKVALKTKSAVERVDPVVIFVDMADSRSKDVVAECLRPYAQFTRPGIQPGAEQIYTGIGFANQSAVERGLSWTTMIAASIAEAAWPLWKEGRPITFETLWPRAENNLIEKGIIEI